MRKGAGWVNVRILKQFIGNNSRGRHTCVGCSLPTMFPIITSKIQAYSMDPASQLIPSSDRRAWPLNERLSAVRKPSVALGNDRDLSKNIAPPNVHTYSDLLLLIGNPMQLRSFAFVLITRPRARANYYATKSKDHCPTVAHITRFRSSLSHHHARKVLQQSSTENDPMFPDQATFQIIHYHREEQKRWFWVLPYSPIRLQ